MRLHNLHQQLSRNLVTNRLLSHFDLLLTFDYENLYSPHYVVQLVVQQTSDVNKARTLKANWPRPRPSRNAKVNDNDEVMKSCFFTSTLTCTI